MMLVKMMHMVLISVNELGDFIAQTEKSMGYVSEYLEECKHDYHNLEMVSKPRKLKISFRLKKSETALMRCFKKWLRESIRGSN